MNSQMNKMPQDVAFSILQECLLSNIPQFYMAFRPFVAKKLGMTEQEIELYDFKTIVELLRPQYIQYREHVIPMNQVGVSQPMCVREPEPEPEPVQEPEVIKSPPRPTKSPRTLKSPPKQQEELDNDSVHHDISDGFSVTSTPVNAKNNTHAPYNFLQLSLGPIDPMDQDTQVEDSPTPKGKTLKQLEDEHETPEPTPARPVKAVAPVAQSRLHVIVVPSQPLPESKESQEQEAQIVEESAYDPTQAETEKMKIVKNKLRSAGCLQMTERWFTSEGLNIVFKDEPNNDRGNVSAWNELKKALAEFSPIVDEAQVTALIPYRNVQKKTHITVKQGISQLNPIKGLIKKN